MKRLKWQILLGLSLVVLSILFYILHYVLFRDAHHIFIYLLGDIAFVFIEVLLVTIIIHRLLSEREKQVRLEKMNMVIGAFFSEAGNRLLNFISGCDPHLNTIRKQLMISNDWSKKDFTDVGKRLKKYDYQINIQKVQLKDLRTFLMEKSNFFLRLLENPNLLEHESFTELLRTVFHLTEELVARKDLHKLPATDQKHLANDIKRAYIFLISEWLGYIKYLQKDYPYLFSLVIRMNPFNENASPIVN